MPPADPEIQAPIDGAPLVEQNPSTTNVVITAIAPDDPRVAAHEQANPGWLRAVGERHQRLHAEHVARLNAKVHQRRMFARAAAGLTKHPQVLKVAEPTRRARERKAAPSRRSSSSSSTSSQDPGDSDELPAPGWRWAHSAGGRSA
jgi:hypothetical protein